MADDILLQYSFKSGIFSSFSCTKESLNGIGRGLCLRSKSKSKSGEDGEREDVWKKDLWGGGLRNLRAKAGIKIEWGWVGLDY